MEVIPSLTFCCRNHPAQFPIAVIERIIKASSNPQEIILDPFVGSGTTALVSLNLQRICIGFEIRQDYCDIAANRIDKFLSHQQDRELQLSLF